MYLLNAINLDDLLMTHSLDAGPGDLPKELPIVFERLAIDNISSIPVSSYAVIKKYLDSRRLGLILDQIESIAKKLRDSIVHNFTVKDILLKVGNPRLALADCQVFITGNIVFQNYNPLPGEDQFELITHHNNQDLSVTAKQR